MSKRLTFVDLTEQGLQLTKEEALALQSHISKIAQHGDDGPNVIEFEKGSMYTAAKANELKTEQANDVKPSTGFETAQSTAPAKPKEAIVQKKLVAGNFNKKGNTLAADGYKIGDMYPRIEAEKEEENTGKIKREVTQEDLDNNPDLITEGVKVGDVIEFDAEPDTEQREVTQADLDADPALVADGVKVGDVIAFPKVK